MSRYSAESAISSAGVRMSTSRLRQPSRPTAIRAPQSTTVPMSAVVTAVFMVL